MTYRQYFSDIKKGTIAPLYLLHGPEEFLQEQVVKTLADRMFPGDGKDFNWEVLDCEEIGLPTLFGAAETLPFGAVQRLVVAKNCSYFKGGNQKGRLNKEGREQLLEFLENLPPTTCLVFRTRDKVDQRQKPVQLIRKRGRVWDFPLLKGGDLNKWIWNRVQGKGVTITRDGASYLAGVWVYDLNRLDCELEKLASYVGPGGQIGREHVELLVDTGLKENVFQLLDTVGQGESHKALSLLDQMLASGEPPLLLLFQLAQRFRLLGTVKALAQEGVHGKEIASHLKQHPFVIEKVLSQEKNYDYRTIKKSLELCLWADRQLKGGLLEPRLVLELLLLKITGKVKE